MSHEQTITVEVDGKWWNIPTVIDGKKVGEKEATDYALKSGKNFGSFGSLPEAENAARTRSEGFGNMAQPVVAPQVTQGADLALQPEGGIVPTGQNFDSLKNDWMTFFQRPEVISGMLQFGASALAGSDIGTTLAESAQAASGTRQRIQQRGQESVEMAQKDRRVKVEESAAKTAEDRNRIEREQLAQQGSQFGVTTGLKERELGIEEKKANAYAKYLSMGAGGAGRMSAAERALNAALKQAHEVIMNDPEYDDATAQDKFDAAMDLVAGNKLFSPLFGGGEVPPPGADTAPGGANAGGESVDPGAVTKAIPPPNQWTEDQAFALAASPELEAEAIRQHGDAAAATFRALRGEGVAGNDLISGQLPAWAGKGIVKPAPKGSGVPSYKGGVSPFQ